MRWQRLFDDLEAQFQRETRLESVDEDNDQRRFELANRDTGWLLDEFAQSGVTVEVVMALRRVRGCILRIGVDWVAVRDEASVNQDVHVIALTWIDAIEVASPASLPGDLFDTDFPRESHDESEPRESYRPERRFRPGETRGLIRRLTLRGLLGDLSRRRVPLTLLTRGLDTSGTISVVGGEWCVVSCHPRGASARRTSVTGHVVFAIEGLQMVTLWA